MIEHLKAFQDLSAGWDRFLETEILKPFKWSLFHLFKEIRLPRKYDTNCCRLVCITQI